MRERPLRDVLPRHGAAVTIALCLRVQALFDGPIDPVLVPAVGGGAHIDDARSTARPGKWAHGEVHALFDREDDRAAAICIGPVRDEEVGEAGNGRADESPGHAEPLVVESPPVYSDNLDRGEEILRGEARRHHEDVDVVGQSVRDDRTLR